MTLVQYIEGYAAITYLLGAVWFLFLERKDGFLKWRVIASVLSPLAVPLLAIVYAVVALCDKFLFKAKDADVKKA